MIRTDAALALLLLTGCGAQDSGRGKDGEARVTELERQVAELQSNDRRQDQFALTTYNAQKGDEDIDGRALRALAANDEILRRHINTLRVSQGLAPVPESTKAP